MDNTPEVKTAFNKMIDDIHEYYGKEKLSTTSRKIYFGSLRDYTFDQVRRAVDVFLRDGSVAGWPPKADHLIKILDDPMGIDLTPEESRAWANLPTPNLSEHEKQDLASNKQKHKYIN